MRLLLCVPGYCSATSFVAEGIRLSFVTVTPLPTWWCLRAELCPGRRGWRKWGVCCIRPVATPAGPGPIILGEGAVTYLSLSLSFLCWTFRRLCSIYERLSKKFGVKIASIRRARKERFTQSLSFRRQRCRCREKARERPPLPHHTARVRLMYIQETKMQRDDGATATATGYRRADISWMNKQKK